MKLSEYIKDKWVSIFIWVISVFLSGAFMTAVGTDFPIICIVDGILAAGILLSAARDFNKRKRFYDYIEETFLELEEKSYLTALLDRPSFFDGGFLYDLIKKDEKYFNDQLSEQRQNQKEYQEYVEGWIHEVKTPITIAKLIAENHRHDVTRSIDEELDKIENCVEQMLYYSKSESVEEDYRIKSVQLKELASAALRKNAKAMIEAKVAPKMSDLEVEVLTDPKWMEFIIGQILLNSVKYRAENRDALIVIQAVKLENNVKFTIEDNGIGMPAEDVSRVFKKGFTGENGRRHKKSTGMGLYLVKKLCDKMNVPVEIESSAGEGTAISFYLPI